VIAAPSIQDSLRVALHASPPAPSDQRPGSSGSPSHRKCSRIGWSAVLLLLLLEVWTANGQIPLQSPPTAIDGLPGASALRPEAREAPVKPDLTLGTTDHIMQIPKRDARMLSAAPDKVTAQMNLAMAYYKKGDLSHAQQLLENLHGSVPNQLNASVLLAYVYMKQGAEAKAVALLTPLERGHENDMGLEYILAFGLIETGKEKEGIPRMEKVAHATHSASAFLIAGSVFLQRSHMRDALADLNAALRLEPSLPGLSTMVGQAYYGLGDMKSATSAFRRSLRANPWDFTANLDLGAIQLAERNYESARPLLELALETKPDVPLARLEMAKLNAATGKYVEAAAALESLVKAEPSYIDAHWTLATVYFNLNRPEDGRRERAIAQELRTLPHPQ
jgi:tetratricopeptide (TPR) repeat protein